MNDQTPPPIPEGVTEYSEEEILNATFDELLSMDSARLEITSEALIARALARFSIDEMRAFLRLISERRAWGILAEMHEEDAGKIVGAMRESRALKMLAGLDPDDAADVISALEVEDRQRLLAKLPEDAAREINYLLRYDPHTAGGIMTTEVAAILDSSTTDEAIQQLRRQRDQIGSIYYLYVVDDRRRLVGVLSMRDLLLAPRDDRIADLMETNVRAVCTPDEDREKVAMRMAEHNLVTLPVIDSQHRLIGMVTHDDVLDILQDEATEDLQKMVGAGPDESIHDPLSYSIGKRQPWLLVNLVTISLAAGVVYFYQDQIERVTLLAVLMPIIANLGGNTGAQTLAVLIRSLATGDVQKSDSSRIIFRESLKGLINGFAVSLISAAVVYLVTGNWTLVLVVFLAMVLTMAAGGLCGAGIPLLLKRFGYDPAQSSAIFVTGIVDIIGFFFLLQLATIMIF